MKAKIWSGEVAPFEKLVYQNTEPNFDLVHPVCIVCVILLLSPSK